MALPGRSREALNSFRSRTCLSCSSPLRAYSTDRTLAQFFETGLPAGVARGPALIRRLEPVNLKAKQKRLSERWWRLDADWHAHIGREFIARHHDRLAAAPYPQLLSTSVLDPDSEGPDTLRICEPYLLAPIWKALEVFHSRAADNDNLRVCIEYIRHSARDDSVLIKLETVHRRTVAVLEFVGRGYVKQSKSGFLTPRTYKVGPVDLLTAPLEGKSAVLAKYATDRATRWHVSHVAVIDWESMILWSFDPKYYGLHRHPSRKAQREEDIKGDGSFVDNPKEIPNALLGFLLRALRSFGIQELNEGEYRTAPELTAKQNAEEEKKGEVAATLARKRSIKPGETKTM